MYEIIGKRILNLSEIIFEIADESGNTVLLNKNDTYKLIEAGQVADWKLQEYKENILMYSDTKKISDLKFLESLDTFRIVSKLEQNNKLVGYRVLDTAKNKELNLQLDKVFNLANNGNITNAVAYIKDNTKFIGVKY